MSNASTRRAPYLYEDDERETATPVANHRATARRNGKAQQPRQSRQRITEDDEALLQGLTWTRHQQPAYDDDDYEPPARSTRPARSSQRAITSYEPPRQKRGVHWLLPTGITLLVVIALWMLLTSGASWWAVNMSDPSQFAGKLHGTIVTGVYGGGDSQEHKTKLIGWNNGGKVQIIKITANDPAKAQIITGPDLTRLDGFPDPAGASVELQTGDFDKDGHLDLKVTIYASVYDFPFHRYNITYTLYGDDKGNLKPRQQ